MHLLIFSKDRACQLNLLLESVKRFGKISTIDVLYKASTSEYNTAYEELRRTYIDVAFIQEQDFVKNTMTSLELSSGDLCLSTDDQVFYGNFSEVDGLLANEVFSYRLGLNTIVQNFHTGELQLPLTNYSSGEYISWNPQNYHPLQNYGYPFAIDTHVYNRNTLLSLLKSFTWRNTNEMESGLFNYRSMISVMKSYRKSVSFNIPCNNMSGVTISGKYHSYSNEELNKLFLNGYKISLDSVCNNTIKGCHQEVKYEFIKS